MPPSSRRKFIKDSFSGLTMLGASPYLGSAGIEPLTPLKVVCVGAHPDDPESGCGGTLAKLAQAGHTVTIIYLTRGEAGIPGKTNDQAASIRSQEAVEACKVLKAKPAFAGQIDGDTVINNDWVKKMQGLLGSEKPDIVFTHWPIDSHKDHQIASLLTIQCWMHGPGAFDLYFFEVCTGAQTSTFSPTDYVDITVTQAQKRKAVYCHLSQDPAGIYGCGHEAMEKFRGMEMGVIAAESFVRMVGKQRGNAVSL